MLVAYIRISVAFLAAIVLAACATIELASQSCPPGTQPLQGCPPIEAVADSVIGALYAERSWVEPSEVETDPILFGSNADIPINDALAKFIGSSNEGGLSSLAAKIWMIEQAEHTIDVMYYIFRTDLVGYAILGALCDAVQRGVDVRIMIDDLGSSDFKQRNFRALNSCATDARFMRNANGDVTIYRARMQTVIFNDTSRFSSWNRRSHDKLLVIDGHFSTKSMIMTGGRNVSLDYYGILPDGSPNPHTYRDAEILVRGIDVAGQEAYPVGKVSEIYFSLLFQFRNNKLVTMGRSRDPAEAYREERQIFHDNLMDLKQLPRFAERLSSMPQFMSEGFHETEVRLAHELSNLTNTNVVSNAVENLELNPNSIVSILTRLKDEHFDKVRIVSPYMFAARYLDDDGNVVVDGAQHILDWLDLHPDSTVELVTNSVLTSDNFMTQSVIDMDLMPRLLLSEEMQTAWRAKLDESELNPELVDSATWHEMVSNPRLIVYETGRLDDEIFGGEHIYSKLHAKYIIGDDIGFIGTTNFDYRSRLFNNELGFFFRSQGLSEDVSANTDYLISLSYRWGSPEWLEMRRRLMEMSGTKASTTRKQRGIFRTLRGTGLVWQL